MNAYLIPANASSLKDNFGRIPEPYVGGGVNVLFWAKLEKSLRPFGIELHTYDLWSPEKKRPDDMLLVALHPDEPLIWKIIHKLKGGNPFEAARRKFLLAHYKDFSKRILLQLEPPVVTPWAYAHMDGIARTGIYTKIFTLARGGKYDFFNYFESSPEHIISPYFDRLKTKFLTMINSNPAPHTMKKELYGERIKAICYWSASPDFDLYGGGWGKFPRHPLHLLDGPKVRKVWRGSVPEKMEVMSHYKFSLCFENCICPGYVSEKIFDCLAAGSIPVYFGAPDVERTVPASCFIDFRKFKNYKELDAFLRSRSEKDLAAYRESIREFLETAPQKNSIRGFAEKLLT